MIRAILNKLLKYKNPDFQFADSVSDAVLLQLAWSKTWGFFRSFRLIFFGKIPHLLFFDKGIRLFNPGNIQFGRWVQLEQNVYLSALGQFPLTIGNNVRIGAFSRLIISTTFNDPGAFIRIGDNVGIGEYSYLGGAGGLEVGDDCIIGQYFSCHPENHRYEYFGLIRNQGVSRKGIRIGKNCWIGSKVTILDGVNIGDNCVVAAGAVVTRSMPSNVVIGGVPAKVLKQIKPNKVVNENYSCNSLRCASK